VKPSTPQFSLEDIPLGSRLSLDPNEWIKVECNHKPAAFSGKGYGGIHEENACVKSVYRRANGPVTIQVLRALSGGARYLCMTLPEGEMYQPHPMMTWWRISKLDEAPTVQGIIADLLAAQEIDPETLAAVLAGLQEGP